MNFAPRKLRYIAEELNSTEKDYVASLKYIITVRIESFLLICSLYL